MKHEQLLKDIDEMIAKNRCYRIGCLTEKDPKNHLTNLNKLLGRIKTILKTAGNEYERGCEDAWEFCGKIASSPDDGGYSVCMLAEIFGGSRWYTSDITNNYTYKEALAKVEAYEKKKKEEAEKPVIGDVVEVRYVNSSSTKKGILIGENCGHYSVKLNEYEIPQTLSKTNYTIKKTGKHFDIQGMLDEIKTED